MIRVITSVLALWTAAGGRAAAAAISSSTSDPRVQIQNGTYVGARNTAYNQDYFLGIPYAQSPVGDLRFTTPQPLNQSWTEERSAKDYSDICVGYGTDSIWYPMSEDCLTLNVVRDASVDEDSKLPVGVWFHGGGFVEGSGSDQRYNMSAIVSNSYKIDKPFIAVTLNYRLSAWGFLASHQVASSGNTNLGLRDQRLALQWIQENIAAFGGDPRKVTIWGESAGAMSIGYHLTAYGGRDDGLFRAGIMESGGSISANTLRNESYYQDSFDALAAQVGCADVADVLQCLREVPFETLNAALNGTDGSPAYSSFLPLIDGDLIQTPGSVQLNQHAFVRVPIIAGTNSDEGTSFGPTGINSTEEFYSYLTGNTSDPPLPPAAAKTILDVYPDDPSQGVPAYLGNARIPSKGLQWRRTNAYAGDYMMHANRRRQCEAWAETSTPAFCYRFNVRSADADYLQGAMHFEEVAFVFNNIAGRGYHYGKPFRGVPRSYLQLSEVIAGMWAAFIHDLDPNYGSGSDSGSDSDRGNGLVRWDQYARGNPVDIFFDANANGTSSKMEADTWRKDGIDYINSIADVYER